MLEKPKEKTTTAEVELKDLKNVIQTVKELYKVDFGEYAMSSFKRRIERILQVFNFANVELVVAKLKADKVFGDLFIKEVTVNTTEMFRDPSFWKKLREEVMPALASKPSIRIWHSASSTGEEVYSMAILLKELGLYEKAQIVASDINTDVIATAKKGVYPNRNGEIFKINYELSGGIKGHSTYMKPIDSYTFQLDPALMKNVTYRQFDLVQGKAFSKFDIILCRNVLIYFNLELQDRVVQMFNESMFTGALLAIGSKENIAWCKSIEKYSTVSIEERIYKKVKD